jgi:hypothetical protein
VVEAVWDMSAVAGAPLTGSAVSTNKTETVDFCQLYQLRK